MAVTVTIELSDATPPERIECSAEAMALARYRFNPSGRASVHRLKALASAFISECRAIQETMPDPQAKREAAIAITDMQKTVMMAVAAATVDLA